MAAKTTKATFAEGTYVFVPDEESCFVPAKVNATFLQGAQGSVSILGSKQQYTTITPQQSDNCIAMDAQSLESIDNMVDLKQLNNASILHNLRHRFQSDTIYTAIGTILVSINPFKLLPIYTPDVQDKYIKIGGRRLPPHIFGVADLAFRNMTDFGKDQACIVSGESGAGKTEATKLFLAYMAEISARRAAAEREKLEAKNPTPAAKVAADPTQEQSSLQDRLLEANPLMEAFGNAKTSRNDNSSRFGKWIAVELDQVTGSVIGGSITDYLLEKSRIVKVNEGERNYHVFYQLCAGCSVDSELRDKLKATDPASFFYLNQSSVQSVPHINDEREWSHTKRACETIGISDKISDIQRSLAGILHLGNVTFKGDDKSQVVNKDVLTFAASLLGVDAASLEKGLICKNVSTGRDTVFKDNNVNQAIDARDAFAKAIYGNIFTWLIVKINAALGGLNQKTTGKHSKRIIGVLDIFGFESFVNNSFEQLCINYCNEKLQGHFNHHIFMLEQEEYKAEGVDVSKIEFFDNSAVLDVLERKKGGVFSMIDEEISVPRGSDETLLKKVLDLDKDAKDALCLKRPKVNDVRTNSKLALCFYIVHYAGEVGYDVTGFLYKNKDELPADLEDLACESKIGFIRDIFDSAGGATAAAPAPGQRKSGATKKTLGSKFKDQLTALMTTLNSTEPHFVRCVKPNAEKVGNKFTAPMALDQLRYSGLLEVCRIRQYGYPVRKDFKEFIFRYAVLAGKIPNRELKTITNVLVEKKLLVGSDWQIGKNKVFMRSNVFNALEIAREDALKTSVAKIQKIIRGFTARRRFKKWKKVLAGLEEAIKKNEETALEDAILEAGILPGRGARNKLVNKAHDALENLRVVQRAAKIVEDAMRSRDLQAILSAIEAATKAKAGDHPIIKKAKSLCELLKQEDECKNSCKTATTKQDIKALTDAVASATKLGLQHSIECREAEATLHRLQKIEKLASELTAATAKKDEAKIKDLLTKMTEVGARSHPAVAEAEKATHQIAEMSAKMARKVGELKQKLDEARIEMDFQKLCDLEVEVQELGLAGEPEAIAAMKVRAELELERHLNAQLETAIAAVENKADSAAGLTKDDITVLSDAINAAKKQGASKDSESLNHAMDVEARVKKQIAVQTDLANALRDLDEAKLKEAASAASELGLQTDDARRAQQEVHRFESKRVTLAAVPKKRGSLRGSLAGAAAAAVSAAKKFTEKRKETTDSAKGDELQPATEKDLEKNYQDRIAKAASSSKVFQGRLFRAIGPHFHFSRYLRIRPDEDYTELEPSRKKRLAARRKLRFQKDVIPKSILLLKDHLSDDAVKIFDAILCWCGDKPAQFQASSAEFVLMKGLKEPRLVDEIFVQLMKQLTEPKKKESEERAWLLLCMVVQAFPPTKEFEAFVLNFLSIYRADPGMTGNYARFCIFNVGATEKIGPSKFYPSIEDIELYLKRPPVMLKVHQIFRTVDHRMTWNEIPVWPCHNVDWVCKLVAEQSKVPQKTADFCGLFVKDVEGFWGAAATNTDGNAPAGGAPGGKPVPPPTDDRKRTMSTASNADGTEKSTAKKFLALASVSMGAAMNLLNNATTMMKSLATVGRDPPQAIAPWPLPASVYPGDVYAKMAKQDRVPVFTYQRKLVIQSEVATPDKACFLQTLMAVVSGQLPIPNEAEVVELAALALASRGGTFPESAAALVMSGLFTYIPVSWCENKSETFWTNAVSSFIRVAGKEIPKMAEQKIYDRYLTICKRSPLFGACLFSVVRKEDEASDYLCGINAGGVHVVNADTFKITGTIPFTGIEKFGASATYVWFSVADAIVKALPGLFPVDKFGNENSGIIFLHSSQAAEIYHITYEYAYFQAHGKVKAPTLI